LTPNGTRVFAPPGTATKAEGATGKATGKFAILRPQWAERGDLPCQQPYVVPNWWHAPQDETVLARDEAGRVVLDGDGDPIVIDRIILTTQTDADTAAAFCQACPMRVECGTHGLQHEPNGIWGGIKVDGLNALKRREQLEKLTRRRRRRSA